MIPIQKIINEKLILAREKHDKKIESWHCSRLGGCLRGLYFERLGIKPDKELTERELRVFDAGRIFEDWIVGLIGGQEGVEVETQTRVEDKELNISGRLDLLLSYQGEKKIYELKSKHSRAFWYMVEKGEGANRQHEYQLWLYLKMMKVKEGSIIYVSKDDLAIQEYPVRLDDKKIEGEVMAELNVLNRAWKFKDATLIPLVPNDSWKARFCRYHSHCLRGE